MRRLFILLSVLLILGLIKADYVLSGGLGLPAVIKEKVKELDKEVEKQKKHRALTITGRVTKDGVGVKGVKILYGEQPLFAQMPVEKFEWTTTDSNGYYTLIAARHQSYFVVVDITSANPPHGYIYSPTGYCLVPAGATNIDFKLVPPDGKISGKVTDNLGNPMPLVIIIALVEVETRVTFYMAITTPDGNYSVDVDIDVDILGKTYNVFAWKKGYTSTPGHRIVTVPPDATGIDFTLTPE